MANPDSLAAEVGGDDPNDPVAMGAAAQAPVPVGGLTATPPPADPTTAMLDQQDLHGMDATPAPHDRIADLNGSLAKLDERPSTGRGILGALLKAAPILLASKFGGRGAAAGAATGTVLGENDIYGRKQTRRNQLLTEIQQEETRREKQREFDTNQSRYKEQMDLQHQLRDDTLNSKTASYTDPETGVATTYQYNAKTDRYDIPLGPVAQKAGAAKPDLEVKMVEGAPVVYQRSTNKYYDPNDKAAPPEVKAAAAPFISAHNQKRREESSDVYSKASASEKARIDVVDRRVRQRLLPIAEKTVDTDNRLTRMRDDEAKGNAGDPQADQDMLYNHMAMTVGGVTGGRITEDIINKHIEARSVPEDVGVLWKKIANGESLHPDQRRRMVALAEETAALAHEKFDRIKDLYGVTDMDLKPSNIQADHARQLNGTTPGPAAVPPGFVKPKPKGN